MIDMPTVRDHHEQLRREFEEWLNDISIENLAAKSPDEAVAECGDLIELAPLIIDETRKCKVVGEGKMRELHLPVEYSDTLRYLDGAGTIRPDTYSLSFSLRRVMFNSGDRSIAYECTEDLESISRVKSFLTGFVANINASIQKSIAEHRELVQDLARRRVESAKQKLSEREKLASTLDVEFSDN